MATVRKFFVYFGTNDSGERVYYDDLKQARAAIRKLPVKQREVASVEVADIEVKEPVRGEVWRNRKTKREACRGRRTRTMSEYLNRRYYTCHGFKLRYGRDCPTCLEEGACCASCGISTAHVRRLREGRWYARRQVPRR